MEAEAIDKKYIKTLIVTIILSFSGIIFGNIRTDIKENMIKIDKLEECKMDKSEISSRLDRIEGYLIGVTKKSVQNDIYIETLSEDVKELKDLFKKYVK